MPINETREWNMETEKRMELVKVIIGEVRQVL